MACQPRFDNNRHGQISRSNGCTIWMESQYRARSITDMNYLTAMFPQCTKAQLRAFLVEAGKSDCGMPKKEDLVRYAIIVQHGAWYPTVDVDAAPRVQTFDHSGEAMTVSLPS